MASLTSRLCLSAVLSALLLLSPAGAADTSTKRGLVFTPNSTWPQDNYIWTRSPSDLTWYYNYGSTPSPVYSNLSQSDFEFIPMLWGAPADTADTTFLDAVKDLIANGRNVTHVFAFNEPELSNDYGGSDIEPSVAAAVWVANIIPLQKLGLKVGLPSCSGSTASVPWLNDMLGNCSKLISTSGSTKNCTYDFVPLHWYGNFEGLASHIGTYSAAFPNASLWVTEFNLNDQSLAATQDFFNSSIAYLDRLESIGRYSLFGAFRSSVSSVGPNAAMLSAGGELTDIGAWYLGEASTGVAPDSTSAVMRLWNRSTLLLLSASFGSAAFLAI